MGLYIRKIKWFFIPGLTQSELKTEIISDKAERFSVLMRPEWVGALGKTFKEKEGAV